MESSRIEDGVKLPLFNSEKQEPLQVQVDERATPTTSRTTKQTIVLGWYIVVLLVLARGAFNLIFVAFEGSTEAAGGHRLESYWAAPDVLDESEFEGQAICKQADLLAPSKHADYFEKLDEWYQTDDFKYRAYEALGGAVRIPCGFEVHLEAHCII